MGVCPGYSKRRGECRRCGACCIEEMMLEDGSFIYRACPALTVIDSLITCVVYDERPDMCRVWPKAWGEGEVDGI